MRPPTDRYMIPGGGWLPCCACQLERLCRWVQPLPVLHPVSGLGWGCAVCDIANDGAIAVLCDACAGQRNLDIHDVCAGSATDPARAPYRDCVRCFEHDHANHMEICRGWRCRYCNSGSFGGMRPDTYWVEKNLCSYCAAEQAVTQGT